MSFVSSASTEYHNDYSFLAGYAEYSEAYNFAPQIGVFEIRDSGDPSHGQVNMQVILHQALDWCGSPALRPVTLGGNYNW